MAGHDDNSRIKVGTTIIFAGAIVFVYACTFAIIQKVFPNWQYLGVCSLLLLTGIAVHRNYAFAGILYSVSGLVSIIIAAGIALTYGMLLANPFFIVPLLLSPLLLLHRIATVALPIFFAAYLIRSEHLIIKKKNQAMPEGSVNNKGFDIFSWISSINESIKKTLLSSKGPRFNSTNLAVILLIGVVTVVIAYSILKSYQ